MRDGPGRRLDDGEDALGSVGGGELGEDAGADVFDRHGVPLQLGAQLVAAGGALELGRHERAADLQPGGDRFLHQADPLDQREPAPAARLAPLEIANRPLQITGYAIPPLVASAGGGTLRSGS